MKTSIGLFFAMVVLAVAACTMSPKTLPPGEYSHTESSTNANGTTTENTTNTNVYYDQNGNKRAVQQTETTRDPPGLFNKQTTKSTATYN